MINYEIKKHEGVISEDSKGWRTELNLISWNGMEPKYDIRCWSSDHTREGKGLRFTNEELAALANILIRMDELKPMINMYINQKI